MATIRLKRRAVGGAAGAPASLATTEPAYNESDDTLYLGKGDDGSGGATSIIALAGRGAFVDLSTAQVITGAKTFAVPPVSSQAAAQASDLMRKGETDTALAGKSNVGHTHPTSEVTGLDTALAAKAPLASPALTGTPTAPTPTAGDNTTKIATTAFVAAAVDAARQGLSVKDGVRVATTANITLSGTQTIDGVAVVAGDRVLVKNQTTASANGIYIVAAGAWTRSTDFDMNADVANGAHVFVEEGSTQSDSAWVLTNDGAITIGTTALAFAQFSGAGQIVAATTMLASTMLSASVTTVVTQGYYKSGDGGGAMFALAATQTAGPGRRASADGRWWEINVGGGTVRAEQFGWTQGRDMDVAPVLQEAHDYLKAQPGMRTMYVSLPPGIGKLSSVVTLTDDVIFVGQGFTPGPGNWAGTVLQQINVGESPIKFSTVSARGGGIQRCAFFQTHPAGVPGQAWSPTVYAPFIDVTDAQGEVTVDNVFPIAVYDFIRLRNSGRFTGREVRGQVFRRWFDVDTSYDVNRITDVHHFNYWSGLAEVKTYQQANTVLFYLGRCDTPMFDRIFAYTCYAVFQCVTTAAGGPAKIEVGTVAADFAKYAFLSEANGVTANIANLDAQGEAVGTPGQPIPGARAILLKGIENDISVANFRTQRHDICAIEIVDGANGCDVRIGNSKNQWFDMAGPGGGVVKISPNATASNVWFANAPVLSPSNAGTIYYPGTVVQTGLQVNRSGPDGAYLATGDGYSSLRGLGPSANIDMRVVGKGSGRAGLYSEAARVLSVDGAGGAGLLARSNAADVTFIAEGDGADVDVVFWPKGAGSTKTSSPFRPGYYSVSTLPASAPQGSIAYCANARALAAGGAIEPAGAGTGAIVVKGVSGWVLAGTNIPAQA